MHFISSCVRVFFELYFDFSIVLLVAHCKFHRKNRYAIYKAIFGKKHCSTLGKYAS